MSQATAEADSIPMSIAKSDANNTTTWNGTYIIMTVTNPGFYYALAFSWIAYQVGLNSVPLQARVTAHSSSDFSFYPLYYEHSKGDFNSIQGFLAYGGGSSKNAISNNGGNLILTPITSPTDWTVDHEFMIAAKLDQSQCAFFIDGANVATNHSPYIAAQPFAIICCETEGATGSLYAKFPGGVKLP